MVLADLITGMSSLENRVLTRFFYLLKDIYLSGIIKTGGGEQD